MYETTRRIGKFVHLTAESCFDEVAEIAKFPPETDILLDPTPPDSVGMTDNSGATEITVMTDHTPRLTIVDNAAPRSLTTPVS